MMDLRDLYQEVIIDHNRCPRNFHTMEDSDCDAEGFNPLCGDQLHLYLKIQEGIIKEASFTGHGCAISTASASLLTESIIGKTKGKADELFNKFHNMVLDNDEGEQTSLGKLSVLSGVKEFPARVKCATLAWHTLQAALQNSHEVATTE